MPAAVTPITRQSVGKTFIVAISILGVGAMAQLLAVGWLFFARFHTAPLPENPGGLAANSPTRDFTDPFADASLPSATASPAPATTPAPLTGPAQATPPPAPPRPSPVSPMALNPQASTPEATQQDRFNELIDQGRILRDRSDTYAAVTKLREAQALDPKNPVGLAELAMTYEKMGFADKAAEYWKRIYDMGESSNVYYAAAEGKLNAAKAKTLLENRPDTSKVVVGMSPASKLGLGDITRTDEDDPNVMRRFTLHVPVKAKPRVRIDAADVVVQVVFYDVLNGKTLEKTRADVSYKWAAPPASSFWVDEDVETLEVTYTLPKTPQGEPIEDRKYYGFVASVYYKNALQDYRSDPQRLSQQAPPPRSLSQEVPQ